MTDIGPVFEKCLRHKIFRALIRRTVSDAESQPTSPARSKESIFIYIVDDEPTLLELAEYILEMEGYKFEKFEEPKKALAAFQAADPKPDLIITDYVMLGMDGLQLVGECQRIKPDLKSILVSGTVQEEVVHRSPTKVDSFLRKPYLAQEFLATVGNVLNLK
jgi:two-component system cell cycle sensor histidine kinase/response regulator CckA